MFFLIKIFTKVVLIYLVYCGLKAHAVEAKPFWTEKASWMRGNELFVTGIATHAPDQASGRQLAFEHGLKEIENFLGGVQVVPTMVLTQMVYEEADQDGYTVYRLLRMDTNLLRNVPLQLRTVASRSEPVYDVQNSLEPYEEPGAPTSWVLGLGVDWRGSGRFSGLATPLSAQLERKLVGALGIKARLSGGNLSGSDDPNRVGLLGGSLGLSLRFGALVAGVDVGILQTRFLAQKTSIHEKNISGSLAYEYFRSEGAKVGLGFEGSVTQFEGGHRAPAGSAKFLFRF